MDTTAREYEAGWARIAERIGRPFSEHLDAARHLVGDVALLDLMQQFPPGEVIIACGIEAANIVLRDVGERFGHGQSGRLPRAVRQAHRAWRSTPDGKAFVAATRARRDLVERSFLDAASEDHRIDAMRAFINERRMADGLSPLEA